MNYLPFRCSSIDDILGGGLEQGIITKVFGEAGTGKSTMCLQAIREAHRHTLSSVIIDSEGVSTLRLQQLCKHDDGFCDVFDKLLVFHPRTFFEQEHAIQEITKRADIDLIVIDTMNLLYRVSLSHDLDEARRCYVRQMTSLQMNARSKPCWVLLAEQVYTDQKEGIQPFTHKKTEHMVKTLLHLEKRGQQGLRSARLLKHRTLPTGKQGIFRLTDCGMQ